MRVRLSNAFGKETVAIGAVHIALKDAAIAAGSDRVLTFSGRPSVAIPPDAGVLSDPVKLSFPAAADLAISIFLPEAAMGAGMHYGAEQTIYAGPGDLTAAESLVNPQSLQSWVFLTGVDVTGPRTRPPSWPSAIRSLMARAPRWMPITAGPTSWRLALRARRTQARRPPAGIGGTRICTMAPNIVFGVNALARLTATSWPSRAWNT